MSRLGGLYLRMISLSLSLISLSSKEGMAQETAVHVYYGCVNVIPANDRAKLMALCAEKGPQIVDGDSAIIQAGFVDHMDDWERDYPRLEELIIWPLNVKDVYIGGDLCIYREKYRIFYDVPSAIFGQCIDRYYDRALGKVSNPYYVWYHKDKNLKADDPDGSNSFFAAGADEYQEYTAGSLEQQQFSFQVSEGEHFLDHGATEGDPFALEESPGLTEHENGSEDIAFVATDGINAEDMDPFTVLPASAGNDLEQPFRNSPNEANEPVFDPLLLYSPGGQNSVS